VLLALVARRHAGPWLPAHQRLVLDPLRLIRVDPLPLVQIRLVFLVIPLNIREGVRSSRDGALHGLVLHTLSASLRVVRSRHKRVRDNARCHKLSSRPVARWCWIRSQLVLADGLSELHSAPVAPAPPGTLSAEDRHPPSPISPRQMESIQPCDPVGGQSAICPWPGMRAPPVAA
jgi:hypothetical protein